MRRRCLLLALFVVGTITPPLAAQTTLAWKWRAGDTFDVEQHISQTTALETKNKPFKQKSELTLQTRWRVNEAGKDAAKLTVGVAAYVSKTFSGDGKTGLPSKEDEQWLGAEFRLTVDAGGRIRELKGHEELLKKLAGESPQRLKILTALKPPDYFQSLFQDVLGPLPGRSVQTGERWQQSATEAMSIFGALELASEFTYQGPRDGLHAIASATKTTYKAPRYAIENDVFRILKGEVKSNNGAGLLLFDAGKGRMQRVQKTISVSGDLTLETLSGRQRVEFGSNTDVRIEVK